MTEDQAKTIALETVTPNAYNYVLLAKVPRQLTGGVWMQISRMRFLFEDRNYRLLGNSFDRMIIVDAITRRLAATINEGRIIFCDKVLPKDFPRLLADNCLTVYRPNSDHRQARDAYERKRGHAV